MIPQVSYNEVKDSPLPQQNENDNEENSFWDDLEHFVSSLDTKHSSLHEDNQEQ